jgi:3-oxoacyl-[acyl-carrier-protein] synthase-3
MKVGMTMNEVQIIGTGSYAPYKAVSNDDISKIVDTSDEWIRVRTGIAQRRVTENENTSDICIKAAERALKSAGTDASEIELIIVATITPDYFTPSTACLVQKSIGAFNATCFDISSACSGFIYGLFTASQFIRTGAYKTALVIGAETLSKILDWKDRNTCILFGDGGGAAVLKASDKPGLLAFHAGSDGRGAELLKCSAVPVKEAFAYGDADLHKSLVTMDGKEIFKFAVKVMEETIRELLKKSELDINDIKYIIPHQANYRIIEFTAKRLGIPEDKFYMNLQNYGNTSAGSIPIALDEVAQKGLIQNGDKLLLVGFGGGLTWGGTIIEWTV